MKITTRLREREKEKRKRKRKVTKRKRRKKREKEKENCPLSPRGGSRDKSRPNLSRVRVCVREVLFEPVGISDRLKACVCVCEVFTYRAVFHTECRVKAKATWEAGGVSHYFEHFKKYFKNTSKSFQHETVSTTPKPTLPRKEKANLPLEPI